MDCRNIKFTVVTCTYNAERTVKTTLDSVMGQTWRNVEHIIMDGGSADGTVAIAESYKAESDATDRGHEVVIVSEPDNGLYDAMNKALGRATGDYVVFMNAGDSYPSPHTLSDIAACVGTDGELPAVLYGDTDLVDMEGRFVAHRRLTPPERLDWKSFRHGMLVCHQAFYARADIARAVPYDLRYRFSADVDWCIRIMKRAARERLALRNVNMVVVNYLAEGMTTENHRASLKERFRVMCVHYGTLPTVAMHLWFVVRALLRR